jgi:hypothetical protein
MYAEVPNEISSLCPVDSDSGKNGEQPTSSDNYIFAMPDIALICEEGLYYPNYMRFSGKCI